MWGGGPVVAQRVSGGPAIQGQQRCCVVPPGQYSDLESLSHNPTDGSFAPLASQPSTYTKCLNLRFLLCWAGLPWQQHITSRVNVTCLRMVQTQLTSLIGGEQSNAWWILLHNDRKSWHRRIKKSLRRKGVALIVNKGVWSAVLGCNLKNDRTMAVSKANHSVSQ